MSVLTGWAEVPPHVGASALGVPVRDVLVQPSVCTELKEGVVPAVQ